MNNNELDDKQFLCTVNKKLILHEGKLCLSVNFFDMEIIGNLHGKLNALTKEISNGEYKVIYLSGAINFMGYGDAWVAGRCYYTDGISSGPGYSLLPGVYEEFPTREEAENAAKGMSKNITISNGGISINFDDGNPGDNIGSITYRLVKMT